MALMAQNVMKFHVPIRELNLSLPDTHPNLGKQLSLNDAKLSSCARKDECRLHGKESHVWRV